MSASDKLPSLLGELQNNATCSIEVRETPQGIVIDKSGKAAGALIAAGSLLFSIAAVGDISVEDAAESAIESYKYVIEEGAVVYEGYKV